MKAQAVKAAASASGAAPAAPVAKRPPKVAKKPSPKPAAVTGKLGKVVALMKRPKGTTIAELTKATGWQAHSVRGVISRTIKKKLKLAVISEKAGEVRSYRIKA